VSATGIPVPLQAVSFATSSSASSFSNGLIDVAERFADVVEAAQGRGARKGGAGAKWLLLPAAGASAYALVTSSSSVARQTRRLIRRATDRATDLPDADLFGRVKEVTGLAEQRPSGGGRQAQTATQSQNRRRRASQTKHRRKTTSSG
jgi:hypothetical protein